MSTKAKIYSAYSHPPKVQVTFLLPDGSKQIGRTKQSFKEEADINNIVKKHGREIIKRNAEAAVQAYGDFTEINEYQDAQNLVIKSNQNFEKLPSAIRRKFGNNAGEFLEFATNPKNQDELVQMGLADKPPEEIVIPPLDVNVITPEKEPTGE